MLFVLRNLLELSQNPLFILSLEIPITGFEQAFPVAEWRQKGPIIGGAKRADGGGGEGR